MIHRNNLRIGYWIGADDGSKWIIKFISEEGIVGFRTDESVVIPYKNLTSIPLTEKILLENGFQTMNIEDFKISDGEKNQALYLLITEGIGELWIGVKNNIFHFCKECHICNSVHFELPINGVHTLQNRYFSMFERELEIKLKD